MRTINVNKALVDSDFKGFRFRLYSFVRYRYADRNLVPGNGQILELGSDSAKVLNQRKSKLEDIDYSDMHDPIASSLPKMTLPAIEKRIQNYIKKHQKTPVTIDGVDYILPKPANLTINFELAMLSTNPHNMGSARIDGSDLTITMLVPYLQYAKPGTINKVILHEVAHLLAGMDAGHGKLWEDICVAIKGAVKAPMTDFIRARGKVAPSQVYTRGSFAYNLLNDIANCPIYTNKDALSDMLNFIAKYSDSDLDKHNANYYYSIFSGNLLDITNWDRFNTRLDLVYNLLKEFGVALKYSESVPDIFDAKELAEAYSDNLSMAFGLD